MTAAAAAAVTGKMALCREDQPYWWRSFQLRAVHTAASVTKTAAAV